MSILCGAIHSQLMVLNYIGCKTKPLKLLVKSWNETATPLFKDLKILLLPLLLNFLTAKFEYHHNRLRLPLQIDNYFTLTKRVHSRNTRFSSNNQLLFIPLFKTQRTQRSIKYIGAKLWNSILEYLKNYYFPKFKIEYKIFLLYSAD